MIAETNHMQSYQERKTSIGIYFSCNHQHDVPAPMQVEWGKY